MIQRSEGLLSGNRFGQRCECVDCGATVTHIYKLTYEQSVF